MVIQLQGKPYGTLICDTLREHEKFMKCAYTKLEELIKQGKNRDSDYAALHRIMSPKFTAFEEHKAVATGMIRATQGKAKTGTKGKAKGKAKAGVNNLSNE